VLLTSATGLAGGLALRECLHRPDAESVTMVGGATGEAAPRLREVLHDDFIDFTGIGASR
jgi:hypothetical protein